MVGNHLFIISPCDPEPALREWWLRSVAPLPEDETVYKEKMTYADCHELAVQDLVQPGGDTGDIDAAGAEQKIDETKDQNTSFGLTHLVSKANCFIDEDSQHVKDEYQPILKCPLCQPEATRTQSTVHETTKFSSLTSHVVAAHDAVVYRSSRGYTCQQLIGSVFKGGQTCTSRTCTLFSVISLHCLTLLGARDCPL